LNYSFKIKARNDVGFSLYSDSITILAAMISDTPLNLMNVPSITTAYQIGLTWIPGLYDGGTPIIDYRVSFKEVTSVDYRVFATNNTLIPFTVTGLVPGVWYVFVVEARNLVGYSLYSESTTILAAQIPDQPINLADVPTITLRDQIGLSWSPPVFNGGSAVIDYRIWFDDSTNGQRFTVL